MTKLGVPFEHHRVRCFSRAFVRGQDSVDRDSLIMRRRSPVKHMQVKHMQIGRDWPKRFRTTSSPQKKTGQRSLHCPVFNFTVILIQRAT